MDVRRIGEERLRSWLEILVEQNATPVLLVAVGHEDRSGEVRICFPEDLSEQHIKAFLLRVVQLLDDGEAVCL